MLSSINISNQTSGGGVSLCGPYGTEAQCLPAVQHGGSSTRAGEFHPPTKGVGTSPQSEVLQPRGCAGESRPLKARAGSGRAPEFPRPDCVNRASATQGGKPVIGPSPCSVPSSYRRLNFGRGGCARSAPRPTEATHNITYNTLCVCIYIYIYTHISLSLYMCIYIYIYTCT